MFKGVFRASIIITRRKERGMKTMRIIVSMCVVVNKEKSLFCEFA